MVHPGLHSSVHAEPKCSTPRQLALRHYGFAIFAAAVAAGIHIAVGKRLPYDIAFLCPFIAIATSAMFGGWGAGVTAAVLIAIIDCVLIHHTTSGAVGDPGTRLLLEAGTLLSIVGGEVFAARRRSHAGDLERLDLERKVLEISDAERSRIGHDLHDGLGQHLTGISLLSASLAQRLESGAENTSADARQISQLVAQTIGWTRDLARGLSPVTLESDGLRAALEELAQNAESLLRIRCSFRCEGPEPQIDRQSALHIFRIVQEAVNNSVRHGKATSVLIRLVAEDDALTARVIDDGCGLSAKTKAQPGLGLRIMNYRARIVGARLTVDRADQAGGTVISCTCKIPKRKPG